MGRTSALRLASVLTFAAGILIPHPAAAQGGTAPYIVAGWASAQRESLNGANRSPNGTVVRSAVTGVTLGAGVRLNPWVSLDGTVELQSGQTIFWESRYLFGSMSDQLLTDRDMPLLGTLRIRGTCARLCGEFSIGGGFNAHLIDFVIIAECRSNPTFHCTPLDEPRAGGGLEKFQPMISIGLSMPVRVARRITVAPGIRLHQIWRGEYGTSSLHRGPGSGRGRVIAFGITSDFTFAR